MAERIGFIGLGIMGKPMAKNLLKAGYSLTVYDIVGDNMEEVVTEGATGASSSREVAAVSDKIITMLPDSADSWFCGSGVAARHFDPGHRHDGRCLRDVRAGTCCQH